MEELIKKVVSLETDRQNIFHQLDEIKAEVRDIHNLTVSLERIAIKMDATAEKVDRIDTRLGIIEQEPSEDMKHYKRLIVGCIITGIIGAIIGAVLALVIR